ncbi:MAG: hypothetical protein J6Y11_07215 [Paludibacteraceae bacterium]|nr:hypothetical protein [Paludibacteraceae bacterium]
MKSNIPSIVFLFFFMISLVSCNESKIGDNVKVIEDFLPHNDSIVTITTMVDSASSNETVFEKDNPYEGFYDYKLMKDEIERIAGNMNVPITSDSTCSFKNKDGYLFNVRVSSYEGEDFKNHILNVVVFPPKAVLVGNVDVPAIFDVVSSEISNFHDYILIHQVDTLCRFMKERMVRPWELLKKGEIKENPYLDSCLVLSRGENRLGMALEGCDFDFPNQTLSFDYEVGDRFEFEYFLALP